MSSARIAALESAYGDLRRDHDKLCRRVRRLQERLDALTPRAPQAGQPVEHDGWDADGRPVE